jgi:hypothetical protein
MDGRPVFCSYTTKAGTEMRIFGRAEFIVLGLIILGGAALWFVNSLRARETARRLDCLNRLRQTSTAAHVYHDAHRRLPPGTLGNPDSPTLTAWESGLWKDQQFTSSQLLLLPFMEVRGVMQFTDRVSFDYKVTLSDHLNANGQREYDWFGDQPHLYTLAQTNYPFVICPADITAQKLNSDFTVMTQPVIDESSKTLRTVMYTMHWSDPVIKQMKFKVTGGSEKFAHTNYLACYGVHHAEKGPASDFDKYAGAMTVRHKMTLQLMSELDGVNCTIMFGETIGEIIDRKRTRMQTWTWGGLGHGFGDFQYDVKQAKSQFLGDANNASIYGFGSMHRNVVNFSTCSASTHSINRNIDADVYQQLCGRNDGEETSQSAFAELPENE